MKIKQLTIRRYRVFDKEVTIPLSDFTVLTGPNNLGKSTVLRALNVFFGALQRVASVVPSGRIERPDRYDPDTDYPKLYAGRPGRRYNSRLSLAVNFSPSDIQSAIDDTQLSIPSDAKLVIEFARDADLVRADFSCPEIQDTAQQTALKKWLASRFRYVYIPANRNITDFRRSVYTELVASSIQSVKQSRKKVLALEQFYADVSQTIAGVEDQLAGELRRYLPELKAVRFTLDELDLLSFIRVADVSIDDGANTSLMQKGDGVKSLFAMSVLQLLAKQRNQTNIIFAIEEPEAHLHPTAIYDAKASLRALSQSFQVLITTHSPILVQRDNIESNIIIDRVPGADFTCSAKVARSLNQIRQSLGIRSQDNLTTAELVVVVEGATEVNCLPTLLSNEVPSLRDAFDGGRIRVINAEGSSKIVALLRALARDAVNCIVLVDSDTAGLAALTEIKKSGLIDINDIFQVPPRPGCAETEFEDLFEPEIYISHIAKRCGVSIDVLAFTDARTRSGDRKTKMKTWSEVMRVLLSHCGKNWDDIEPLAKTAVAEAIRENIAQIPRAQNLWLKSIADRVSNTIEEK
jgi:putative ATP-dependent endonuclease of OLD family